MTEKNFSSHYLKTLQINKQNQALRYSYETLGNLLSSAENFAGEPNENYGQFNVTTSYNYNNLKSEFIWELYCFQLAIKKFQNEFQLPYKLPTNFNNEKIQKDINRYMKKMKNEEDKKLYKAMINLINGKEININFDKLFEELDKNANSKINPTHLREMVAPINQILDKQSDEAERGNMNLELDDNSHINQRNKLKNSRSKIIKFEIGKLGELRMISSGFNFIPEKTTNTKVYIKIDEPLYNHGNLIPSLYSYNKHLGHIYIIEKRDKNSYLCVLFNNTYMEFNESLFNEIARFEEKYQKAYIYGKITISQGIEYHALIEDLK